MIMKRILTISILSIILIVWYNFSSDIETHPKSVQVKPSNLPLSKRIEKNIKSSSRSPITVLNSPKNALRSTNSNLQEEIKEYQDIITSENAKSIANQLIKLDELQKKVISWKRDNNIKLFPLEEWSPKLILTLSILTGQSYQDTLELNTENLDYSVEYWQLLRSFSNSNDLQTLIRKDKLDSKFLTERNLKLYY